ncbi:hypothetical protein L596_027902 [Steinernema carpocapsae]|uniref:Uncharacterized protein n=1 Tax=Steinernema carpocapsae TaxID=34508 RepID=A0A4U5LWW2_STECR|nr:hypothetical protein L596_027902 [Steinernema carpocapsae]
MTTGSSTTMSTRKDSRFKSHGSTQPIWGCGSAELSLMTRVRRRHTPAENRLKRLRIPSHHSTQQPRPQPTQKRTGLRFSSVDPRGDPSKSIAKPLPEKRSSSPARTLNSATIVKTQRVNESSSIAPPKAANAISTSVDSESQIASSAL